MPHIHEKIDYTADVFVVFEDKVLLRKHEKYDKWLAVGGHIELDEDPNQAAIREVKEEVGLDITLISPSYPLAIGAGDLIPPRYVNRHPINDKHEHISLVFFATSTDNEIKPAPGEVETECKWFTMQELVENAYEVPEGILFHAKGALDELAV